MGDLILSMIVNNSNRIDQISKYINKNNIKNTVIIGLIIANMYIISKNIKKQNERINNIEKHLMIYPTSKSKGE